MTPLERFEKLKSKYRYDAKAAEEKIQFIEKHCRHVEGDLYGEPLILPDTFKDEIIRPIFGLKKENGKRLIRYVFVQTPKKNAKTLMMAAIENTLLFNDGEPSAQIYNCAGDDEQAGLLFSAAKKMVELDPELSRASKMFQGSITYKHSFIKKITSKSDTKHGFNSHGVIYDELHVAKNSDLHENLQTSMAQRSNPMMLAISTPGVDKLSICYNRYDTAKKILEGVIEDDSFWCVIYESDKDADIYSEETWRQANPLYDYSENLRDTIAIEANRVKNDVSLENTFRRLRLGQWTSSEFRWIKSELWTSLKGNVSRSDFDGDIVWLGLDLSASSDLTSLCSLFSDGDICTPFWDLWIPKEKADEYEKKFNIPFSVWAKQGYINICPGNTIDFRAVEKRVLEIQEGNSIKMLGYDEWNSRDMATRFTDQHGIECIIEPQGYRLSSAIKKIKELIINGKFCHSGNPVVTWCLDNVMIKENDEGNIKIVKPKTTGASERYEKKIDPWISLAMAVNEWMIDVPKKSVYAERGVQTIE